ncbi:MAG: heme exporter protein CcmD [Pseudomonadota bacterium]
MIERDVFMLPQFEDHAPYIYAAYGLAAVTLGVLVAVILFRARSAKNRLERLQRQVDEE